MRILALGLTLFLLLLAAGCPRHDTTGTGQQGAAGAGPAGAGAGPGEGGGEAGEGPGTATPAVRPGVPQVVLIFSATPGDPWAREIVQTVAGDLDFEAWSAAGDAGGLDTYGPYDVALDDVEAQLHIAFSGLAAVATIEEQQALGQRGKDWLDSFSPKVVWLDGDIAQFQIGKLLELDIPIVFSGVMLDANLFYSEHRPFTGVYRRHGISAVLGRIWDENPDARHYALISDDSPLSAAEVRRFVDIQALLGEGHFFTVQPTVHNWGELRTVFGSLGGDIDAAIVCGMGNQGCSPELTSQDCPDDILRGVEIPVVILGPSKMDQSGGLIVNIRPAAHARHTLELVRKLLGGAGTDSLPVETPDDMSVFQADTGAG